MWLNVGKCQLRFETELHHRRRSAVVPAVKLSAVRRVDLKEASLMDSDPTQLELKLEFQESHVVDEVSAVTAIVRPILSGILYSLKHQVVTEAGGHKNLKLFMLPRLRRPGDGDIGICFEYAVHDAIKNQNPLVMDRIETALRRCNVPGSSFQSILFGAEKNGALNLIDTASELLSEDAVLLYGKRGRPARLKSHIWAVAAAFRQPMFRDFLPQSISGLWKADLFAGAADTQKWVGTSLKINRSQLEGARGLRLGIIPASEGESDGVYVDDHRNLVVCPLPYDRSFMQAFYQAWEVVIQFLNADAQIPKEAALPRPPSRQVARYLADRRDFPIFDVLEALEPLSQPHLLRTQNEKASVVAVSQHPTETTSVLLAPMPQNTKPVG